LVQGPTVLSRQIHTDAAAAALLSRGFRWQSDRLEEAPPEFGTTYHGFFQFPLPGSRFAFGHDGETLYQNAVMIIAPDLLPAPSPAQTAPSPTPL
jgi:hypothetical protein